MQELVVKTVFLSSDKESELEDFINEFVDICAKYEMSFRDICDIFETISLSLTDKDL